MSKTIFPQTQDRNWIQQNKGDLYPVLYSTRNINLDRRRRNTPRQGVS